MPSELKISVLVDDKASWIMPYARQIVDELSANHFGTLIHDHDNITEGDLLFLLGCTRRLPGAALKKNRFNLVIHESALPVGRGWSPVSWQVMQGMNRIPIVVFEAAEELDAGDIYLRDFIELDGTELLPEIKAKQGLKTIELVHRIIEMYPGLKGEKQRGVPSYFAKRSRKDDLIDINNSIAENFDHLRIVDNLRYPAWFKYRGEEYLLKIYKKDR
jgi:methionyl-tRNA formyltransferase